MRTRQAHRDFHRKFEPIDFGFPAFCWHNYPLCLPRSHSCEGYRDGAEKAKSIRWQAQEEIQDRDPKDGSAWGKKRRYRRRAQTLGDKVSGAVVDTVKGTDKLRNKLEPPATSETQ